MTSGFHMGFIARHVYAYNLTAAPARPEFTVDRIQIGSHILQVMDAWFSDYRKYLKLYIGTFDSLTAMQLFLEFG